MGAFCNHSSRGRGAHGRFDAPGTRAHPGDVATYLVTADDRARFVACPRAWDLGARARRDLEPVENRARVPALPATVRAALAVHYFPGMWTWDRRIVAPLVRAALERTGGGPPEHGLLIAYADWAREVDDFTPIRVESDVDVAVPHPDDPDADLATPDGAAVRYRERIPLVVVDDTTNRYWLVEHRVIGPGGEWTHDDELALDERGVTACWAWERLELGMPVEGVQYNELDVEGRRFRRVRVHRTAAEKAHAATRLAHTARRMLDTPADPMPTPAWSHCRDCEFRAPCIAMDRGADVSALLEVGYRRRPADVLAEGRLGGVSWGMGRGAAPPHLGGGDDGHT